MTKIEETHLSDVKMITPQRYGDERGFFSEVWSLAMLVAAGIDSGFVQDNHAFSADKGTVRGLHYQADPMAQGKLVRVARGAVLDVVVDIRRGSPQFGQHVAVELSAENWTQLWVPAGFAHGYITLTENVEFLYKVTKAYSPDHERGILWNDPALGIDWRMDEGLAILSDKDKICPLLRDQDELFTYEGF